MLNSDPARQFHRFRIDSGWEPANIRVTAEAQVSLSVNGQDWLSFTCTPADQDALAVGFLYNEKIIQSRAELAMVDVCRQGTHVDVWLTHSAERPARWLRTSGCAGGQTSVPVHKSAETPTTGEAAWSPIPIDPLAILRGMEQLLEVQDLYRKSGGIHCSALSDGESLRLWAEDIGRHNTLDKLAGRMIVTGIKISPILVLTTGRVSSEMLQKSARLGASVVVSRTSPTELAVATADALGIVLGGYVRRNGFTIYTHPKRLTG